MNNRFKDLIGPSNKEDASLSDDFDVRVHPALAQVDRTIKVTPVEIRGGKPEPGIKGQDLNPAVTTVSLTAQDALAPILEQAFDEFLKSKEEDIRTAAEQALRAARTETNGLLAEGIVNTFKDVLQRINALTLLLKLKRQGKVA